MLALPVAAWQLFALLDYLRGDGDGGIEPETPDAMLGWYRLVFLIWFPLQLMLTFGLIYHVVHDPALASWEMAGIFFGVGVLSGTIDVNNAHELLHRQSRTKRWLADLRLALVFYSHFRSEHLLVHHRFVAPPPPAIRSRPAGSDAELAVGHRGRGGGARSRRAVIVAPVESVLALRDAAGRVRRAGAPRRRHGGLGLPAAAGGRRGLAARTGENYVEHYGLRRRPLGGGRYEPVRPHHSWNASKTASNKLLINLQLHSDHHCRPGRRYPLLQSYDEAEAPRLPAGYPAMTALTMVPLLWRRMMTPRVRAWRRRHYPDVMDWSDEAFGSAVLPPVGSIGPAG